MPPRNDTASRATALLKARPELAERLLMLAESDTRPTTVSNPDDCMAVLRPLLSYRENEALAVIALDRRNAVVDVSVLTTGNDAHCIVDPRQVLRWALTRARSVSAIILAHNHPSGNPSPSQADLEVTRRVSEGCKAVGLDLLDHVIVAGDDRVSLRESGYMPAASYSGSLVAADDYRRVRR